MPSWTIAKLIGEESFFGKLNWRRISKANIQNISLDFAHTIQVNVSHSSPI